MILAYTQTLPSPNMFTLYGNDVFLMYYLSIKLCPKERGFLFRFRGHMVIVHKLRLLKSNNAVIQQIYFDMLCTDVDTDRNVLCFIL